jgi:hypothetical protein
MAGTDENIRRGFYDTPDVQDRLRKYAQDEDVFKFYALRQANPLSILTVISEKFGVVGADMISDWQFRYQEFDELPYSFTMQAASAQPASGSLIDYVLLTNKAAAGLNTSHRLMSSGTYMGDTRTGATTTNCATTFSATLRPLNEVIGVLAIGAASSAFEGNAASAGNTWVKVRRAHPALSVTGQLAAIPDESTLVIANSVAKTNGRPFAPLAANGKVLYNAVQITRDSYGLGEHMNQGGGIKTFLKEGGAEYLGLNYELCETRLMKIVEHGMLAGSRTLWEEGNESEYETGGILEWVPKDTDHYINFNGVPSVQRVNNVVAQAFDTAGVRELWMFGGTNFTKGLANAYENKRQFTPSESLSIKYAMQVNTIESTGRDGIIYYVNAPVLNELFMGDQALILNLTEHNFGEKAKYGAFQIAEKVPFRDDPEDADSYEANAGFKGKWREIYGAWGLIRRLQDTHFRVYGMTV